MTFLGTLLQAAREKKGLSQRQVSNTFGWTSPQFVSNIERGISYPHARHAAVFSKLYDLSHKEILAAIAEDLNKEYKKKLLEFARQLKKRSAS